jgi:hypothetical protein
MKIYTGTAGHYVIEDAADDTRLGRLKRIRIRSLRYVPGRKRDGVKAPTAPELSLSAIAIEAEATVKLTDSDASIVEVTGKTPAETALLSDVADFFTRSTPSIVHLLYDPNTAPLLPQ